MKKTEEPTLSRWGRYKKVVSQEILQSIEGLDDEEQSYEILRASVALEVVSLALLDLATKLSGNEDCEEIALAEIGRLAPLVETYVELTSKELERTIKPSVHHDERPYFPKFPMKRGNA
tara:strand:+ start:7424 stop:7780 length:357 start_codon:yes stop_codon:yes gene_type:complete